MNHYPGPPPSPEYFNQIIPFNILIYRFAKLEYPSPPARFNKMGDRNYELKAPRKGVFPYENTYPISEHAGSMLKIAR